MAGASRPVPCGGRGTSVIGFLHPLEDAVSLGLWALPSFWRPE